VLPVLLGSKLLVLNPLARKQGRKVAVTNGKRTVELLRLVCSRPPCLRIPITHNRAVLQWARSLGGGGRQTRWTRKFSPVVDFHLIRGNKL
jgi:hypothetical protein